jgi:hypothetical protein
MYSQGGGILMVNKTIERITCIASTSSSSQGGASARPSANEMGRG